MSAEEKDKVLKDWTRFIENDFSKNRFTKSLYDHLIQHCSFIAHYNQAGFYNSYFADPEDTIRFMRQFDREHDCISVEYGMKYWLNAEDYADINNAMVDALSEYKGSIYPKLKEKAKEKKLAEIERLRKEIDSI